MCIAVRKRIYAILAAMNTTERVVEIRLGKKNSGPYGPEIRKLSIQHGVDKHLE